MRLAYALFSGIRKVLRNWQVIALLVVAQLIAAWLLAAPLASELHQRWDYSLVGEQSESVAGMESTLWDEVLISRQRQFDGVYGTPFMFIAGLVYTLFSLLVIAGALPHYGGLELKFSWDRFWMNASRYFRSFVGLALIAALLFWASDMAAELVDSVLSDAVAGSDDEPTVFFTSVLLTGGFRLLLFSLVVLVFQYAKAIAAAEEVRNIFYLIRRAFGFVSRNFVGVIALFAILGLLELGINALDAGAWYFLLPGADTPFAWGWLILITILLVIVKLSFLSCQLRFYVETQRRADERGRVHLEFDSYS